MPSASSGGQFPISIFLFAKNWEFSKSEPESGEGGGGQTSELWGGAGRRPALLTLPRLEPQDVCAL